MVVLFLLSIPGLVVAVIALGVVQLVRARVNGTKRPGAGSMGLELLDTVLKLDHRMNSIRIKRKA